MSLGIKSSAFLRVEHPFDRKFEVQARLQLVGTLGKNFFRIWAQIFEISGNLEIQKFGIPWNPCDKDFRILDLLEPLRQRFQNLGPKHMGEKYVQESDPQIWGYYNCDPL